MKIVVISDTHSLHSRMKHELPEADLLIHCGDIENSGRDFSDIVDYTIWLKRHAKKYDKVLQIAGNHDGNLQNRKDLSKEMLSEVSNLVYLDNEAYTYKEVKFYGSPITPTFGRWFNMADRGMPIQRYWDNIPDDVEILINHGPPFGTLDLVHYNQLHVGCEMLAKRIKDLKSLKLNCFGHIHETRGITEVNGVMYVNASICDLEYNPINKPVVLDYNEVTHEISILDI